MHFFQKKKNIFAWKTEIPYDVFFSEFESWKKKLSIAT